LHLLRCLRTSLSSPYTNLQVFLEDIQTYTFFFDIIKKELVKKYVEHSLKKNVEQASNMERPFIALGGCFYGGVSTAINYQCPAWRNSKRMLPLPIAEHDVKNKHTDANLHSDQYIINWIIR
jgi:hypothetical protein